MTGYESIAKDVAYLNNLDYALVCAVVEQESGWDNNAIRFEPNFLAKYVAPLYTAGTISATEAYSRCFSWGLMQIMGQTARERGFDGKYLSELTDPRLALERGCDLLAHCLVRSNGDVPQALLYWNGGANKNYPAEVMARMDKYK